jgi:hypothetical protein
MEVINKTGNEPEVGGVEATAATYWLTRFVILPRYRLFLLRRKPINPYVYGLFVF